MANEVNQEPSSEANRADGKDLQRLTPETDPKLNNPDSTPGTGMLPPVGGEDTNMQPSS